MTHTMSADYEHDFHAWTLEQAMLLRSGHYSRLDVQHLAEEIEDLGKRERRAILSRLAVLLGHLLKWRFQPNYPNRKSWRATIVVQRRAILELLDENPSLRPKVPEFVDRAYQDAVDLAVSETPFDYDVFPQTCPWDQAQILGDHWPDSD